MAEESPGWEPGVTESTGVLMLAQLYSAFAFYTGAVADAN